MTTKPTFTVAAGPYPFEFSPAACALLTIDMQGNFLEPGGFREIVGNDISQLRRTIEPDKRLLAAWRAKGLPVIHSRDMHRPDLGCLAPPKKIRGRSPTSIGDRGTMVRILVPSEAGHDITPELYPQFGESVDGSTLNATPASTSSFKPLQTKHNSRTHKFRYLT